MLAFAHLWMLAAALSLDAVVGDPDWLWRRVPHPVVLLGRLVARLDRDLNRDSDVPAVRRVTGVAAMAGRGVDELSGGELQRVWLATCLAQDTGVLLLDEPTTYLDLRYQVEILDLMRDLADDHGVAVGVVLHDLNQAAAVADHVVLLERGVVRAAGEAADVLTADALSETYGIRIEVTHDPLTGTVQTAPVGRHTTRRLVAVP